MKSFDVSIKKFNENNIKYYSKTMEDKSKTNSLLSNISPPSALPNFIKPVETSPLQNDEITLNPQNPKNEPFAPTKFSAAIPPNMSQTEPPQQTGFNENKDEEKTIPEDRTELIGSVLDPIAHSGSLLGWMKDAMPANILQKVAETAKSSVDSLVTTLDPQMKEFIYSGGGTAIIVASDKEEKIRPIREAFQEVFGRATVIGKGAKSKNIASQPVGFEAGLLACQERIADVRSNCKEDENSTIVALENILAEILPNQWFDVGFMFLADAQQNVNIKVLTQMTPLPDYIIDNLKKSTAEDYQCKDTGFSTTIGEEISKNLDVHHSEWHKAFTGVPRSHMILNAARTLAFRYKQSISDKKSIEAETAL